MAVDDDEDSPEAAAARKQARKDRREQNRLKRAGQIPGSIENSPEGSRASTEEPEPTPKKKGRKGAKEKRKAEDEDVDDEPPAKRKRGGPSRPSKGAATNGDSMSPQHRATLQRSLRNVYDGLLGLTSDSDAGSDGSSSSQGPRAIIGPFLKLVKKSEYPDYYAIIEKPISMAEIDRKIKKEQYSSLTELRKDVATLAKNAKKYNEDGSMLYLDAVAIEVSYSACTLGLKITD